MFSSVEQAKIETLGDRFSRIGERCNEVEA